MRRRRECSCRAGSPCAKARVRPGPSSEARELRTRDVDLRRAVTLVLPQRQRVAARARESRPPGIAGARAAVIHAARAAGLPPALDVDGPDVVLALARVLEDDERVAAPDGADIGRERRLLP